MELPVIGISQLKLGEPKLLYRGLGFCDLKAKELFPRDKIYFAESRRWKTRGVKATLSDVVGSKKLIMSDASVSRRFKSKDGIRLFVGLPLDAVSGYNTINHARAIAAGLKALKLLGVEGVELPIWWGVVEREEMGKCEWSSYLAFAEMVEKVGLKLHATLNFHASREAKIPLPQWLSNIGETQPSIFFADRYGKYYKECLSLGVDDLPVLDGKTPIQVYREYLESFKSSFSSYLGSTVTGITVGLGPNGELQYPSHRDPSKASGVGEFQCYDKNMLALLKQHAEATGNPLWGLGGPHDAPSYHLPPHENNFFKDHGGSWETPYGDFFLSWYSIQLTSHGDRLLSLAASTFGETGVAVSGKIPLLLHSWNKTRSHASELTAGFYNPATRNGYEGVAEMFARNSCRMIVPGMDLSDETQPAGSLSCPESLVAQIVKACEKFGVEVSGQNSSMSAAPGGFERMKKYLTGGVDLFTYQRMGAYFFSPEHFPLFTQFVRSLNQKKLSSDDLPEGEEEEEEEEAVSQSGSGCLGSESDANLHVQAA